MLRLHRSPFVAAVLLAFLAPAGGALAQADIGAAASVVNQVNGERPGNNRRLAVGDRVYQNEVISTAVDARGQVLFRDETSLTVGPDSRITLDRFVFNPGGQSNVALDAGKGVFRFVSGSLPSNSYNIRTPAGTIGVRGTIVDWISSLDVTVVQLVRGQIVFQTLAGQTIVLRNIGDVLEIGRDGRYTISSKLTDGQRSQLAVVRDLIQRNDNITNIGRDRVRDVLRRNEQGTGGGGGINIPNIPRPGGGGQGPGGDGG
jgi:hypothetical protein